MSPRRKRLPRPSKRNNRVRGIVTAVLLRLYLNTMKFKNYGWMAAAAGAVCITIATPATAKDAAKPDAKAAVAPAASADTAAVAKMGTLEVQRDELVNLIRALP